MAGHTVQPPVCASSEQSVPRYSRNRTSEQCDQIWRNFATLGKKLSIWLGF